MALRATLGVTPECGIIPEQWLPNQKINKTGWQNANNMKSEDSKDVGNKG